MATVRTEVRRGLVGSGVRQVAGPWEQTPEQSRKICGIPAKSLVHLNDAISDFWDGYGMLQFYCLLGPIQTWPCPLRRRGLLGRAGRVGSLLSDSSSEECPMLCSVVEHASAASCAEIRSAAEVFVLRWV
jgi:hypothetical protein